MQESQNGQFQQPGQGPPGMGTDRFVPVESVLVSAGAVRNDPGPILDVAVICGGVAKSPRVDGPMIEAALDRLSPQDRLLIRLRHCDQLSFERIASGLGLSTKAAQMRWARAVKNLCREMQLDRVLSAARSTCD